MRYAYIETGIVKEISRVNPFGIFNKDYASKFVEVPDDVEAGGNTSTLDDLFLMASEL